MFVSDNVLSGDNNVVKIHNQLDGTGIILVYRIYRKYSIRHILVNSVDTYKTAPKGAA